MCNAVYALILKDAGPFADLQQAREELDAQLAATITERDTVQELPDLDAWGETPEAIAAQEAFMQMRI